MKICHVITGLQKAAGTSTFCGEVCNQLVALGHDVTIAVRNSSSPNLYPLDPRIHLVTIDSILHFSPSPSTSSSPSTSPSPSPFAFSLIHIHGLWSWPLHQVSRWAHAHAIPVVWSTHGMTAPWAMKHKWWKKFLPWHLYQKRNLARAQLIHCTSDFEVEWNRRLGFNRTFIAPLGTFLPAAEKVKVRDEGEQRKTLLFVGRIYPVKALDRLIEAFALAVRRQHSTSSPSSWTLRLVGPDQAGHMAELMSLCSRLGLSYSTPEGKIIHHSSPSPLAFASTRPQVEFSGPKFGSNLESEYVNCDALALVSHTENFGATVVDALAHGKPVITSTKTPWSIVDTQQCGWWVENSIAKLSDILWKLFSSSTGELELMGRNGCSLVGEMFIWQSVVKFVISRYVTITALDQRSSIV